MGEFYVPSFGKKQKPMINGSTYTTTSIIQFSYKSPTYVQLPPGDLIYARIIGGDSVQYGGDYGMSSNLDVVQKDVIPGAQVITHYSNYIKISNGYIGIYFSGEFNRINNGKIRVEFFML